MNDNDVKRAMIDELREEIGHLLAITRIPGAFPQKIVSGQTELVTIHARELRDSIFAIDSDSLEVLDAARDAIY